jgi:hypothetical protein
LIYLFIFSCDGEVDEAHNHLRELDLEIWAAKKSNPLVDLLPDSLAGEISCGEDLSFSRNGEMMILADSVGSSSYLPDRDYFSFGLVIHLVKLKRNFSFLLSPSIENNNHGSYASF